MGHATNDSRAREQTARKILHPHKVRVLIVDDDESIALLIETVTGG